MPLFLLLSVCFVSSFSLWIVLPGGLHLHAHDANRCISMPLGLYTTPCLDAVKINCAIDTLPNFKCIPNDPSGKAGPQHVGTIHFETKMEQLEDGYRDAALGIPARRPVVEMTIPSSLDSTISPPGQHVAQLFVQYAPYDLDPAYGSWSDPAFVEAFADSVFDVVEEYAPGFKASVIGRDVLSPLELERVFGLPKVRAQLNYCIVC